VDWPYLISARVAMVTGITPALSPRLRDLTARITQEMRAAGKLFALDCTMVGDAAFITRAEVEALLASDDQEIQR
jgi:sugar/nucleoside kinase (ribokinase family)